MSTISHSSINITYIPIRILTYSPDHSNNTQALCVLIAPATARYRAYKSPHSD